MSIASVGSTDSSLSDLDPMLSLLLGLRLWVLLLRYGRGLSIELVEGGERADLPWSDESIIESAN